MTLPNSPFSAMVQARNNVRVRGSGDTTIVFAHGFGCDQGMWRFVAPAFESRYRTVLFDYVGCGGSQVSAFDAQRYGKIDGYAQDLLEICAALDLKNAIFVGHSVSASIGVVAAGLQPERFAKLVLLVPSPRFINDPPHYHGGFDQQDIESLLSMMEHNLTGWAAAMAPTVMANADRPELTAELEQSFCSADPFAAKVFARTTFFADNRADLAKVHVPSLVIQVSDDALVPAEVSAYIEAQLPQAQRVVLDASGHCPHMSHPALTIAAIEKFLGTANVAS